jgi:hypothetical protein
VAGVVVDQRRCAVADCVDQTDLCRTAHPFEVQRLVQFPPERLQNFWKIFGRWARGYASARKGAVKMGVGADLAWHEEFAVGIPPFVVGIGCKQRRALPTASITPAW